MKTTGLALAAMAATASADYLPTFNIRSAEPAHIHVEFEDLGYRSAHPGGEHDSELTFYQVSTGESLLQLTTGERTTTLQYLDHEPLTSKTTTEKKENFLQMTSAGQVQARVAGHEALHAHPVFSKFIAKLSQAAGKEGLQGNTHPAVIYLHQTAMTEMKRDSPNAHPHRLHGIDGVPSNLNSFTKGDEFVFDLATSESFLQNLETNGEEWGWVGGVLNGAYNGIVQGAVAIYNGVVNTVNGVFTTIWDTVSGAVVGLWEDVVHVINIIQSVTSGGGASIPIGEVAKYAWWHWGPFGAQNNGRRRRRRRQVVAAIGLDQRPFFDNQNRLWSKLGRCLSGIAMPSGNPGGSPCFGICGPGCVCFIWGCGSCLRPYRACWEHDCACMMSCPNGGDGQGAWDALVCWMFTANLTTCSAPGCVNHYCSNGNNNYNENESYAFDDGDCTGIVFSEDEWSGTDGGSRMGSPMLTASHYGAWYNSEYVVWGMNFPKRGPGGILCWEGPNYTGPAAGPNWDTDQSAWAGGGSFHADAPAGQVNLCYLLQGEVAMRSEQEVDGYRPYGDVFKPTLADLQDLGYDMPSYGFNDPAEIFSAQGLLDKINSAVLWPGCGIDSARVAMNFQHATQHWTNTNSGTWGSHVGGDKNRKYTMGGGVNYRAAYDASNHAGTKNDSFGWGATGTAAEPTFHCVSAHTKYAWTDQINSYSPTPAPTPYPTSYPTTHPTNYPTAHPDWGPCCFAGNELLHYVGLYGMLADTNSMGLFNIAQPHTDPVDACAWHSDTSWMPYGNGQGGNTLNNGGSQVMNGNQDTCRQQLMIYGSGQSQGNTQHGFCQWADAGTDQAIQCPGIAPHTLPTVSPTGYAQAPGTKQGAVVAGSGGNPYAFGAKKSSDGGGGDSKSKAKSKAKSSARDGGAEEVRAAGKNPDLKVGGKGNGAAIARVHGARMNLVKQLSAARHSQVFDRNEDRGGDEDHEDRGER